MIETLEYLLEIWLHEPISTRNAKGKDAISLIQST